MKLKIYLLGLTFFAFLSSKCQVDTSASSFYKIYTRIFQISCSLAACHDGTFEPDLRTIESSYSTLVYHPMLKNAKNNEYAYRVVPGDPAASVLYLRISSCCFVNVNDRMPFTIGDTLSGDKIDMVKKWIEGGAKDICGQTHKLVIAPISIADHYNSFIHDTICISIDSNRLDKMSYQSLILSPTYNEVRFSYDITLQNQDSMPQLSDAVLKISESKDDFSNSKMFRLVQKRNHFDGIVNPASFKKSVVYFMRVELLDQKAKHNVHFPDANTEFFTKLNWSFIVRD